VFLLACWPLALIPFRLSAAAWIGGTGVLWFASVRRLLPRAAGLPVIAAAFTPMWLNAMVGQTGFLTAALFGFALRWLDRRPLCAGAAFGMLCYKPQFGMMVPVMLAATGRWRVFGAAAGTVALAVALSVAAFGTATWQAFLNEPALVHRFLHREEAGSMISATGAVLSLHGPEWLAYAVQAAISVLAAAALIAAVRITGRRCPLGAFLCTCSVLASPWLHRYDLVLLAVPIAWMVTEGRRTGFLPWEKFGLLVVYVFPVVSFAVFVGLEKTIDLPFVMLLLLLLWRRAVRRGPVG
jgi:hypothetical protein